MSKKLLHKIRGDRKYFAIVFFILFLILISCFITPYLIENKKENWDEELSEQIVEIENSVISIYQKKEELLLNISSQFKKQLAEALKPRNISYGKLVNIINDEEYEDYSLEVFAPNGKLIVWSKDIAILQEELFPLTFPAGETYFHRSDLTTYLSIVDTLFIENDQFYFSVSVPVEKHYTIQNPYYKEINFSKELSDIFYTEFEIEYNPFSPKTKDGRKYSFEILNNLENKIALVTFIKPALNTSINSIYDASSVVQSVLVLLAIVFAGLGFNKEFKEIRSRALKLLLFILYCVIFRTTIYIVGFPSNILEGPLVDPTYFSSAFGGGIVKSPIEFFITNFFFLLISILFFRYLIDYVRYSDKAAFRSKLFFIVPFLILTFAFLWIFRGLFASVRSVIFDSTLRYFNEPNLLPDFPSMVMNLNVLILGLATILFLTGILIFIVRLIPGTDLKKLKKNYLYLFLALQILGIIFILFQKEPLVTPVISLFFITIIFLLVYQIYFIRIDSLFNYVYAAFAASVIAITLLNYYNQQLERESLKTAALEINRPNDNLLKFMLNETLQSAVSDHDIVTAFYRRETNYDAVAFKIWSGSSLQKESHNSSVTIFDKNKNVIGDFSLNVGSEIKFHPLIITSSPDEIKIIDITNQAIANKNFAGIVPVKTKGVLLGFISAAIEYDLPNLISGNIPDFLESKKNIINSVIDINQLKIFEITDSRLTQVYGDIYPSRDQIKPLTEIPFGENNEAWLMLNLNDENYLTYALKTDAEGINKLTAVALKEKELSWNLFNFFKLFIIHSIFIFLLFVIFFLIKLKSIKYSFRTQLLLAFLFVAVVPVFVLAIYNRQDVAERSRSAVFNELNERSKYLENHVRSQKQKHPDRSIIKAFENAGTELGISFGVYETSSQIFNSKDQYYDAGLFTSKLNPEVHYHLNYLSQREFLTKEKIEDFTYDSFYKKVVINRNEFILGVNDAFNKVKLPYSAVDIDIFLFGVYSFAAIIIILFSTILANKISSPIRRLTKATEAVAQGDLNVELDNKERGELRDLLEGFNSMTKELQKNQSELAEMEREIAWKEMAKQVAHEIKNPLTPMKLAVQQLMISYKDKNKNFDSIFEKVSATILNQIDNLNLIASEFSRFARMPNYKLETVDLVNVLNDTLNLFVDEKVKIENRTELESALVEADRGQMRRILVNLIRNSIQADSTEIKFNILSENDHYSIIIKDNGRGIPQDLRERIFDSNFTTKEKGMGLGLKLAKRFLEGINGNIILMPDSEPGTTFKVSLPKIHKTEIKD